MENYELLFLPAIAAGVALQFVVRLSNRTRKKSVVLALNILKHVALLCVQILLICIFSASAGGNAGHVSCIVASCVTFLIAIITLLLQYLFERKHPLSDEQKMHLSEM